MNRILVTLLVLTFLVSPLFAQGSQIEDKLSDTKTKVEQLNEIKDDADISDEEKTQAELTIKKAVLIDVLDLGILQLENLKKKLDEISFPDTQEWEEIRESLYERIDGHIAYYQETKGVVDTDEVEIEDIKAVAQSIGEQKTSVIDSTIRNINDIIIVFSIADILSLGDQRLEKVSSDIAKIYNKNLTKNQDLKELFVDASDVLEQAHTVNNRSKEIILHLYSPTTSTSTTEFLEELSMSLNSTTTSAFIDIPEYDGATSTIKVLSDTAAELIREHIRGLVVDSLDRVRETYTIFIEMSIRAQNLLE
jgi:hypothetical protein